MICAEIMNFTLLSFRPAVLCAAVQNARGTAVVVLEICLMPGSLEGFV